MPMTTAHPSKIGLRICRPSWQISLLEARRWQVRSRRSYGRWFMSDEPWIATTLGALIDLEHGWPFQSALFSEELTGRPIVVAVGNFRYSGGFRFDSTTLKEYRGNYP